VRTSSAVDRVEAGRGTLSSAFGQADSPAASSMRCSAVQCRATIVLAVGQLRHVPRAVAFCWTLPAWLTGRRLGLELA
jgi:hypothetical protein